MDTLSSLLTRHQGWFWKDVLTCPTQKSLCLSLSERPVLPSQGRVSPLRMRVTSVTKASASLQAGSVHHGHPSPGSQTGVPVALGEGKPSLPSAFLSFTLPQDRR